MAAELVDRSLERSARPERRAEEEQPDRLAGQLERARPTLDPRREVEQVVDFLVGEVLEVEEVGNRASLGHARETTGRRARNEGVGPTARGSNLPTPGAR